MAIEFSNQLNPALIKPTLIFFGFLVVGCIIAHFMPQIKKLYYYFKKNFKQIFKFALIGGSGVVINSAVIYAMTEWVGTYYMVSNLFAIGVASVWNYVWYKYWVFKK